jgi:peroxiredoxin
MKSASLVILLLIQCLILTDLNAQEFQTNPQYPTPGETVSFKYNPAGGPLEGQEIKAVAYIVDFDDENLQAVEIDLKKEGNAYTGSVASNETSRLVFFSIKSATTDKADSNNDTGFKFMFYDKSRKPVAGANAAKAMMYYRYARMANIKSNPVKALNLLKREFKDHPVSATYPELLYTYATLAKSQNDEEALAFVKEKADDYAGMRRADEDKLTLAFKLYELLGEEDSKAKVEKKILRKFSDGMLALQNADKEFRELESVDDKVDFYNKALKNYDLNEKTRNTFDSWLMSIARDYAKQDNWPKYEYYMDMVSNEVNVASNYNNAAWDLAGGGLEGEAKQLEVAKRLSKKSLDIIMAEQKSLAHKPASYTDSEWKQNMDFTYGMYSDTYALIQYKLGHPDEALKYQELACKGYDWNDKEMNERYALYHEKAVNNPAETEKLLSHLIIEGKASEKMKEQHKRLFIANNTLETAYEKLAEQLQWRANAAMKEELKESMMNEPAPAFALKDLAGNTVSLENLKGKVVVLDFWATWCGPCKASFPGMQDAVNKFASSDEVVFLFVDTWERAEDKAKNAKDFIESKGYSFHVLLDEENKVVEDFGVSGIPTKFIIDKNGNIRFKSVGFGGDNDALVEELSLMIELAGHRGTAVSSMP